MEAPLLGTDVIETIRGSKFYLEIAEQQKAAAAARRREVAAELKRHEASADKTVGKAEKVLAEAIAEFKAAEKTLIAAQNKVAKARAEKTGASFAFSNRHDELTCELAETADPAIAEFVKWTWDEFARMQKVPFYPSGAGNRVKNELTGLWHDAPDPEPSGRDRFLARMSGLREARAAAEEMVLEADQGDVPARLQALRDALPKVD